MMINIEQQFGQRIKEIWDSYNENGSNISDIVARKFAVANAIKTNAILFVGINPSFDESVEKRPYAEVFYPNEGEYTHKYFDKFKDIAEKVSVKFPIEWTHWDLLYIRETNQKVARNTLFGKWNSDSDFLCKQLLLSKEIIEQSHPQIIVVNNTLSRTLLGYEQNKEKTQGVWMDFEFEFSDTLGTEIIKSGKLKGTPVFFTSMLTGQRALDNGSYKRLVWHIKYVLKQQQNQ